MQVTERVVAAVGAVDAASGDRCGGRQRCHADVGVDQRLANGAEDPHVDDGGRGRGGDARAVCGRVDRQRLLAEENVQLDEADVTDRAVQHVLEGGR